MQIPLRRNSSQIIKLFNIKVILDHWPQELEGIKHQEIFGCPGKKGKFRKQIHRWGVWKTNLTCYIFLLRVGSVIWWKYFSLKFQPFLQPSSHFRGDHPANSFLLTKASLLLLGRGQDLPSICPWDTLYRLLMQCLEHSILSRCLHVYFLTIGL